MKIYNDRRSMLVEVPLHAKIAELGTYKGVFAEEIYQICQPSELVLIDLFPSYPVQSGNADGNELEYVHGDELYAVCLQKFMGNEAIIVKRDFTSAFLNYPDNYFDMVYIDADHSYEGVKHDLMLAYQKVKPNGLIMGHDYEFNLEKTSNIHFFGVKQAVDEFCQVNSMQLDMKAMDGCVSFGIRVKK